MLIQSVTAFGFCMHGLCMCVCSGWPLQRAAASCGGRVSCYVLPGSMNVTEFEVTTVVLLSVVFIRGRLISPLLIFVTQNIGVFQRYRYRYSLLLHSLTYKGRHKADNDVTVIP